MGLAAALVLLAMGGMPSAEESRESERPVSLQAVGAVGPGSLLTLQTASGPMQLTVDSQMNPGQHYRHVDAALLRAHSFYIA